MRHVRFYLNFQSQGHNIYIYFLEFCDIVLVLSDENLCYQRYRIECVKLCLTLHLKVEGQKHNSETYFLKFSDIDLVLMDTEHKLLLYILPKISY